MITAFAPAIVTVLAFGVVAAIVFVVGQYVTTQARIQQRVGIPVQSGTVAPSRAARLDTIIRTFFDEGRFGVSGSARSSLRRELVRAGFFSPKAINYYIFFRLLTVVVIPA